MRSRLLWCVCWNEPTVIRSFDIRDRIIIETQAEQLLACLKAGTVSTNVHLRKLHNFCLSMNWLPWPLIPKRLDIRQDKEWDSLLGSIGRSSQHRIIARFKPSGGIPKPRTQSQAKIFVRFHAGAGDD